MLTVTDVAMRLNVNRATAYGLIHLLEMKGLITPAPNRKKTGGKGKPASLYLFTDDHVAKVADLVRTLTAPITEVTEQPAAAAEEPVQAPTTEDVAVAF
jgi:predicted ArsR family transcriptional regulator